MLEETQLAIAKSDAFLQIGKHTIYHQCPFQIQILLFIFYLQAISYVLLFCYQTSPNSRLPAPELESCPMLSVQAMCTSNLDESPEGQQKVSSEDGECPQDGI